VFAYFLLRISHLLMPAWLLLCVQRQLPDVSVAKSVSPTSGVLGTNFTYAVQL
jgi:hypothetical protein